MRGEPLRVYADTSVFGGCFDEEFAKASLAFVAQVREGRFVLVVSPVVQRELEAAPPQVRELAEALLPQADMVVPEASTTALAIAYVDAGVVTGRWAADALHVATAVVAGCDVIVSWNFRHVVHFAKIGRYNAVNVLHGYGEIAIHSPAEVLRYEEDI